MAKVRVRPETGTLYLDFTYRGVRCREQTSLEDNASNRRAVGRLLSRIQREITQGTFDYASTFPGSARGRTFRIAAGVETNRRAPVGGQFDGPPSNLLLAQFAELWFLECTPQWRQSTQRTVRAILDKEILPHFGLRNVAEIDKADVLRFRAALSSRPCRDGTLGPARINKIMGILRQILNEAAERFDFSSAFRRIKPLRVPKTEIMPFSLEEVENILASVRSDYRDYLTVRFFTGMRSGEINALQWHRVDFKLNLIVVRETLVNGELQPTPKTEGSRRDILMVPCVREAMESRWINRNSEFPWIFHSRSGHPVDTKNFTYRVWHPLLRHLGLAARRPYQTRHTAATLMLAAGENPEWIARMLGHANTDMLFRVYSRYVPNMTRQDGCAFAGLVSGNATKKTASADAPAPINVASMTTKQMRELLAKLLQSHSASL